MRRLCVVLMLLSAALPAVRSADARVIWEPLVLAAYARHAPAHAIARAAPSPPPASGAEWVSYRAGPGETVAQSVAVTVTRGPDGCDDAAESTSAFAGPGGAFDVSCRVTADGAYALTVSVFNAPTTVEVAPLSSHTIGDDLADAYANSLINP